MPQVRSRLRRPPCPRLPWAAPLRTVARLRPGACPRGGSPRHTPRRRVHLPGGKRRPARHGRGVGARRDLRGPGTTRAATGERSRPNGGRRSVNSDRMRRWTLTGGCSPSRPRNRRHARMVHGAASGGGRALRAPRRRFRPGSRLVRPNDEDHAPVHPSVRDGRPEWPPAPPARKGAPDSDLPGEKGGESGVIGRTE